MKVKWTEEKPLFRIPERFWGEDLSLLDKHHEGEVIGTTSDFLGDVYLTVGCKDGKVRSIRTDKVTVI